MPTLTDEQLAQSTRLLEAIRNELAKAVVGQKEVIDQILIALLAEAHVLIEGVPGLGKTLLVKALARTFSGQFGRIQFTPDLMPSDVTGHTVYEAATSAFVTRQGPVFTHLLLADEINRAPAKTQAALLEAMQEGQVTLEGQSMALPRPFMVLATQNPIEQEGTYPLPEAQLDRFLFKVRIGYPSEAEELAMTRQVTDRRSGAELQVDAVNTLVSPQHISSLQKAASLVDMDDRVLAYAVSIASATRNFSGIALGAGPRGSISLVRAARARALLAGRGHIEPDDVKAVTLPALRHRITTTPEAEIDGRDADTLLKALLDQVSAPRL